MKICAVAGVNPSKGKNQLLPFCLETQNLILCHKMPTDANNLPTQGEALTLEQDPCYGGTWGSLNRSSDSDYSGLL